MRRSQIAPGVHLSYDAAQKFNRCRISIHFAFPARRETATAHALLPLVMERGYADCPDMTQMTKKLARLYGADLTVDARPIGCSHNLCVSITGIKDQFALEGEKLTQEYAALALGTAFHPYFLGSTFDPEAVGIEKQMLKKALEDEVNDKRLYCQRQANREFFGDSPAGVRQEGYLEEVDGLTPEALTEAARWRLPRWPACACAAASRPVPVMFRWTDRRFRAAARHRAEGRAAYRLLHAVRARR